ncbi:MAG: hypothetical protein ACKVQB_04240 [Bacteroidia bacterium]
MNLKKLMLGVAVFATMFMTSCRKDRLEALETITSAEDNSTAESEFTAAFDVGDDVAANDGRLKKAGTSILPSGAVLTITDSSFTDGDGKEFNVDFGSLGTTAPFGKLCGDGRYRAGKINFTLSAPYLSMGSILTITISENDKFFGGNGAEMTQISGTKVITRTMANQFTVAVSNGKATNDKGTVTWAANRTITRITDAGPGLLGDVFEITGSASGTNRKGEAFTVTIALPLKKKVEIGCAQTFVKGKLTLKNTDSGKEIMVDYDPFGNEACDRTAKATINGKDHIYTVR